MSEHQPELLLNPSDKQSPEEETRRTAARAWLAELIKDPQFRAIEGFPIGSDEDILALSDPPYYTACPNPFTESLISHFGFHGSATSEYHRQPLAREIPENRHDPVGLAHSYHT